jgi:FKBP-type peptidyl-prolyl cis-trans isomerase
VTPHPILCAVASLALASLLGACSRDSNATPAAAAGVPAPQPPADTPPAISPAELEPGKPFDLGSGLLLQVERAGSGTPAHLGSRVQLRYEARVKDAETTCASNLDWDAPLALVLGGSQRPHLLPAVERALIGLRNGATARLEVPAELGYGKGGPAGTEEKALVFQIEIVGVDG